MKTIIVFLFLSTLLYTCGASKRQAAEGDCEHLGTVQDFTGLDGCTLLIVTDDGKKFLPAQMDVDGPELAAGQRLSFSYRTLEDMASICMAEDAIVAITCLQVLNGSDIPNKPDCFDVEDLTRAPWLADAAVELNPVQIFKYRYRTDGWAYLLETKEKVYLYDCQGTMLCESMAGEEGVCLKLVDNPTEGKVIWRAD